MASRADLIMSQVRGELAQINRNKNYTGNVIDDVTSGLLGFQTGSEIMDAFGNVVEGVQEFRDNKYKRQSNRTDKRARRVEKRQEKIDAKEQRLIDSIDLDDIDFDESSADNVYESDFSNMDSPMIKPDRPMVKSMFTEQPEIEPDMMLDEEKLPTSIEQIDGATELFLGMTLDTFMSPIGGMTNAAFAESTGYNNANVNLKDLKETSYDLDAIKATQTAAGVTRFFTGGDMKDVAPKVDEIADEAINKLTTG